MDGGSLARRPGGDQRSKLLAGNDVTGSAELTGGFCLTLGGEEVLELLLPEGEERPVDPFSGAPTPELEGALGQDVDLGPGKGRTEERRPGAVRLEQRP